MDDPIINKFRRWYQMDNPDCPEGLKPEILYTHELDEWGTTLFIVRIPEKNEIQVSRVFRIGAGAEISVDKVINLA